MPLIVRWSGNGFVRRRHARFSSSRGKPGCPASRLAADVSVGGWSARGDQGDVQVGVVGVRCQGDLVLRRPGLRQPDLVEKAMGRQALVLLSTLDAACNRADDLEQASVEEFCAHPDHAIITSFPGLADLTGARVLAEIGDDRTRFADARALKAYAGTAPVTRSSGRSISITFRRRARTGCGPFSTARTARAGPPHHTGQGLAKHRVDHTPVVHPQAALGPPDRQQRLDRAPLILGQLMPTRHDQPSKPTAT